MTKQERIRLKVEIKRIKWPTLQEMRGWVDQGLTDEQIATIIRKRSSQ